MKKIPIEELSREELIEDLKFLKCELLLSKVFGLVSAVGALAADFAMVYDSINKQLMENTKNEYLFYVMMVFANTLVYSTNKHIKGKIEEEYEEKLEKKEKLVL